MEIARSNIEDATFCWSDDRAASLQSARQFLDKALSIDPKHVWALAELAHIYMVEGKFELAREQTAKAIAADPNLADPLHVMAIVLVCLNEPDEALRYAREALKRNPGVPEFYLICMAEAHIANQSYAGALVLSRRIIARRPDWLMAQAISVLSLMGLDQKEEAQKIAGQMVGQNSRFTANRWASSIFYPDREDVPNLKSMLIEAGLAE